MADVTVVVPAYNAAGTLPATLDALARQQFGGEAELVVVDDASRDRTAEVAARAGVRVVRHDRRRGPASSRNTGAQASSGAVLAFTDADCMPSEGWLGGLVAALADADLARGPVTPPPGAPVGPFDRTLWVGEGSPWFEAANLGVRRGLFDRVGGFEPFAADGRPGLRPAVDEGHFGEDVVFGWRAVGLGARVAWAPRAVVHHAVVARGPREFVAERRRLAYFPALVREVPALRSALPGRVFLSRRSALFDLALAGTLGAAALRRPLALAAALPYAKSALQVRGAWRPSGARENAARVAADAVGFVALVRGSVAARTVLL